MTRYADAFNPLARRAEERSTRQREDQLRAEQRQQQDALLRERGNLTLLELAQKGYVPQSNVSLLTQAAPDLAAMPLNGSSLAASLIAREAPSATYQGPNGSMLRYDPLQDRERMAEGRRDTTRGALYQQQRADKLADDERNFRQSQSLLAERHKYDLREIAARKASEGGSDGSSSLSPVERAQLDIAERMIATEMPTMKTSPLTGLPDREGFTRDSTATEARWAQGRAAIHDAARRTGARIFGATTPTAAAAGGNLPQGAPSPAAAPPVDRAALQQKLAIAQREFDAAQAAGDQARMQRAAAVMDRLGRIYGGQE